MIWGGTTILGNLHMMPIHFQASNVNPGDSCRRHLTWGHPKQRNMCSHCAAIRLAPRVRSEVPPKSGGLFDYFYFFRDSTTNHHDLTSCKVGSRLSWRSAFDVGATLRGCEEVLWDPVINFRLSQKICRSSMIQYLGAVFFAPLSRIRNRSPTSPCFSWAGRSADQGSHFRMSESGWVLHRICFENQTWQWNAVEDPPRIFLFQCPFSGFSSCGADDTDTHYISELPHRAVQESWDAESQTGRKLREIRGWYRSGDESFWVNQLVNCPTKVNR